MKGLSVFFYFLAVVMWASSSRQTGFGTIGNIPDMITALACLVMGSTFAIIASVRSAKKAILEHLNADTKADSIK